MSWAEVGLDAGWTLDGPGADGIPARVPGTVAQALHAAGVELPEDLDEHAWTFRCAFATPAGEAVVLRFGGLATLASVELNGAPLLESKSMWKSHAVDVTALLRGPGSAGVVGQAATGERARELAGECTNEVVLHFAALGPEVRRTRKPRARWRTKLVAGGLRWHRTMLLGRMPGIAPGPAVVGPWRPVTLQVRSGVGVAALAVRPRLHGDDGVLHVRAEVVGGAEEALPAAAGAGRAGDGDSAAGGLEVVLDGPSGEHRAPLDAEGRAELRIPGVARWWPHTHGEPVLHDVRLVHGSEVLARRRVGFRELVAGPGPDFEVERDGLDLHVNGVRVFARGAVWTPLGIGVEPVGEGEPRATLAAARDAGLNLVRVVGTAAYEDQAFHDACDELGLLVWQDVMVANMDYPLADPDFAGVMEAELAALLAALEGHPSTAVVCGGSEVGQQVAMLGLDPALAHEGVGHTLLPRAVAVAGADVVVVPDAPSGGPRPFRSDVGVANWFGVGGYRRPIADARRAGVRFASECLALANVPDEDPPDRTAGVPRDAGADWDFADVRDHYLRELHGIDPAALWREDPAGYFERSRAVTGAVMAEVLGEWRRAASPCGGAIVLWLRDLVPGSGWGILDHRGRPKPVWHHLRRVLAPVAVWTTDEGLNGIAVHVANDGPEPLSAELHVALLAADGRAVEEATTPIAVAPHTTVGLDAEELLGRWADASWAYGFGERAHEAVVVTLNRGDVVLSQASRAPLPVEPRSAEDADLSPPTGR